MFNLESKKKGIFLWSTIGSILKCYTYNCWFSYKYNTAVDKNFSGTIGQNSSDYSHYWCTLQTQIVSLHARDPLILSSSTQKVGFARGEKRLVVLTWSLCMCGFNERTDVFWLKETESLVLRITNFGRKKFCVSFNQNVSIRSLETKFMLIQLIFFFVHIRNLYITDFAIKSDSHLTK